MRDSLDLSVRRVSRRGRLRKKVFIGTAAVVCAALAAAATLRFGPGAVAWLAALPQQADEFIGSRLLPRYTGRLEALQAENAALRAELAETSSLQAENAALRTLLQSPRAAALQGAQPMQVAERWLDGFALAGSAEPGSAVLDPYGRFAGRIANSDEQTSPGILQVASAEGTPCLAGGYCGVLTVEGGQWYLDGLPRHCGLAVDTVVTTADGYWVGRLAAVPTEDETGLCARALLDDVAEESSSVYFAIQ
ncbi:hypothetical protein INF35_11145 [Subdoligranulum sp. DSM 109015]|uniref:Cell shape-determining protein MreC n=1 Tax=Gemmiger gallinarum TaxID=2779354 RepID=A0ABR9R5B7_9FIRM|nr:hypothetical protein [Gemmiger gallinarum]MBE5038342.1 hypothetical protein [Gemmiger gallinarum]